MATTEDKSVLFVSGRTIFITLDVFSTIFGNILSAIVVNRTAGFSDSVQTLMTSLCLADLGVGLTLLSSVVASGADAWIFGDPWCKITAGLLAVCLSMSVFSLLGVSLDRLVVIRWPLRHPMLFTKRRVQIACLTLWILSTFTAAGNVMMHQDVTVYLKDASTCYLNYQEGAAGIANEVFVALVLFIIPLGTIILIYAILLHISTGHQQRLRNNMRLGPRKPTVASNPAPTSGREASNNRGVVNRKALTMFLMVSLGFTICWAPHFVLRLYGATVGGTFSSGLQMLYAWLPLSNSFWNVVIYTLMNSSFRKEAFKLLGWRQCCSKSRIAPGASYDKRYQGDQPATLTSHLVPSSSNGAVSNLSQSRH